MKKTKINTELNLREPRTAFEKNLDKNLSLIKNYTGATVLKCPKRQGSVQSVSNRSIKIDL